METYRGCGLLLVDGQGRVAYQPDGLDDPDGGRADELQGMNWKRALERLLGRECVPERLPRKPTTYPLSRDGGNPARLHAAPLPPGTGYRHVLFVGRCSGPEVAVHRLCTLGMLAAGAAHEMNNLLTLVSGWASLAAADSTDERTRDRYLQKVAEASDQLSSFAQNLLDLARERGKEWGTVDVNGVCRRVAGLVDYPLEKDDVKLELHLAEENPLVEGSEGELTQTLLNLVMNARQAMPEGGRLAVATELRDGWVTITVEDTGCGIEPEHRDRVFRPFFTTRSAEGGTGLGLAVCRQMVDKHRGRLELDSAPGVGTTASVRLPELAGGSERGGR